MIPDLTNATPATREYYALPEEIRTAAVELAGPLRPMTHIETLLAIGRAIAGERERDRWQPMETAPKHGRFLAAVDGEVRVVSYGKTSHLPIEGFCLADQGPEDFDLCKPTVWQPLPEPPGGDE